MIFFTNVHLKRKHLIFHGILLTTGHHSEKNLNKSIYKEKVNTNNHKLLKLKFPNTAPLPSRIFGGVLKTFLYPQKILVCRCGGLETETGKFHEILTVFFLLHEHLQRKSTFLLYPPPMNTLKIGGC